MHPQKKWREAAGVSQGQLSIASKIPGHKAVDQGLISKVERDESFPGIGTAAQLCIATAKLSSIVEPLRLAQYLPRELMLTYSQTMEDWKHGLAKGEAAGTKAEGIKSGGSVLREIAREIAREAALKAADQRARTRRKSSGKRKTAKAAKAKAR